MRRLLLALALAGCRAPAPTPALWTPDVSDAPSAVDVPGTVLEHYEWRDRLGRNLLIVSETPDTHTISHYAGTVELTLRARKDFPFRCAHHAAPPQRGDADLDGIHEIYGTFTEQCGSEPFDLPWAFEGGTDLFAAPDTIHCGGDGLLSPSLHNSPFAAHLRARWPIATGRVPSPAPSPLHWTDITGDNTVTISGLTATWTRNGTPLTEVRLPDLGCSDDDVTGFAPLLEHTDLDGNAAHEVTLAYTTGCISDVSPVPTTLVLLDGTTRHTITGISWSDISDPLTPDSPRCAEPSLTFSDDPLNRFLDEHDARGAYHFIAD